MIFWISILFSAIYFFTLILFLSGLSFPKKPVSTAAPFISVIIPIKNELVNLAQLLQHLREQNYPEDKHEIIFVDDCSGDGSGDYLRENIRNSNNMHVLSMLGVQSDYIFKKAPLNHGIRNSRGEIIMITDADCVMGPEWMSTVAAYFNTSTAMVAGFSGQTRDGSFFDRFQALDFLMLMAGTQGSMNLGLPWGCSGQNLAFRRSGFEAVGGFAPLKDYVAGDDSLFMQLIYRHNLGKITFAADARAWVQNEPVDRLSTFVRQRIRWATDANYMLSLNVPFFIVLLAAFMANLAPIAFLLGAVFFSVPLWQFLVLVGVKLIGEGMLCRRATAVYDRKVLRKIFLPWFLIQMPYTVFMGVASFFGKRMGWGTKKGLTSSDTAVKIPERRNQ